MAGNNSVEQRLGCIGFIRPVLDTKDIFEIGVLGREPTYKQLSRQAQRLTRATGRIHVITTDGYHRWVKPAIDDPSYIGPVTMTDYRIMKENNLRPEDVAENNPKSPGRFSVTLYIFDRPKFNQRGEKY